ncbi:hypothetical protein V1L54_11250 [Streptomyces sp. TRM 70361]|uniref:hypothetical protein n=1 Tax=Streptomyces sp. TRM 70361 TaxID=3116553 RepID=UPI002E7B8E2B|nr:hypothetical protein [Streptomyces sp. TRM 70361]MEE1939973.1 hypothetical protein [Streptomyces sp. TRM 70361]
MSLRKRVAVAAAAVMVSTGLTLAGASAANAAPATAAGSVGVQSLKWQGPFGSHSSCMTVQNEFQRYYDITIPCKYFASSGYYFEYNDGR